MRRCGAIGLGLIAGVAGGNRVFERVGAAFGARDNVIDREAMRLAGRETHRGAAIVAQAACPKPENEFTLAPVSA